MSGRKIAIIAVLAACLRGSPARAQTAPPGQPLSLHDAEMQALQHHPRVLEGEADVDAANAIVREVRASDFPTVVGAVTGAGAENGTRIAAGGLNNPTILDRFAYGVLGSELLSDFGRTANLTTSASLEAQSAGQDVNARRASVLLDVDASYFDALRAQAVQRVADDTVTARQLVVDQATALANAGIKSTLDVSFAQVNLSAARLLALQARNDVAAAYARLSDAIGSDAATTYTLSEEPLPAAPPADSAALVAEALRDRPDVSRERLAQQSLASFAKAEGDLSHPTVSVIGAAGLTPYHEAGLTNRYGAIGVNFAIPLANGGLYSARKAQAAFRVNADDEAVREMENQVTRDVRIAWLAAQTAFQRLDLTDQLLAQATSALDLAQQRYTLGLSSIVELNEAQLNQTEAQIEQATARYDYQEKAAALRFQTGDLK